MKEKECVQFEHPDMVTYNKQLLRLNYYLKKYEPACELQKASYQKLDKAWTRSEVIWKEQRASFEELVKLHKQQGEIWRESFFKMKDQKIPPADWTKSPFLWVAVGLVVGVTVTVTVTLVVQATQRGQLSQPLSFSGGM